MDVWIGFTHKVSDLQNIILMSFFKFCFSWNIMYPNPDWHRIQLKLYVYQHLQHTRDRVRVADCVELFIEQDSKADKD